MYIKYKCRKKRNFTPKTGYFISSVDGFENIINKENLFEKTVSEIEDVIEMEIVPSEEKIGKIADISYF